MAYSREIYETVYKKLEFIRKKSENEAFEKKKAFYKKNSRAKILEEKISKTAILVAKASLGIGPKVDIEILKEKNLNLQKELKNLLKNNLPYENFLEIKFSCRICEDRGYVDGKICDCFRKLLKKEVFDRINSMSYISLCSFDTFNLDYYKDDLLCENSKVSVRFRMNKIFSFCKNYAKKFLKNSENLFFQGATGLGKTHLSLAIARNVIEKGFDVIYNSSQTIVSNLEKEKFSSFNFDKNYSKYICECDLLIIDDLGAEFSTQFSNFSIYNLIDTRIMLSKPTIISTNLSLEELEKKYTERLVSRIMGEYIGAEFFGEDIRWQKKIKTLSKIF